MTIDVGVIGVGSMGRHHARVYANLPGVQLVGVEDIDRSTAREVAEEHNTEVLERNELIEIVDAVSIVVPTEYHHEAAMECIESGVSVLVEKPFVRDVEQGEELIDAAEEHDVALQVGHIERFNPAVMVLEDVLPGLDIIAFEARRLGPEVNRGFQDSVVMDLMIHDLDIVTSLVGEQPNEVQALGTRQEKHANASLSFDDGIMASFLTSRVTQEKIRELRITAEECYVKVDYLENDIEIHRDSAPEYITDNGDVRYRHESVIERPVVDHTEPLKEELKAFKSAVEGGEEPVVSGEDGLRAVKLSKSVENKAFGGE